MLTNQILMKTCTCPNGFLPSSNWLLFTKSPRCKLTERVLGFFLNWLDLYKPNSNHSSRTDSGNSLRLTSPGYSACLETKQCLEEALQLWQKEHWTRRLLLLASCSQASELKCHFSLYLFPKYTTLAPNPVLLRSTMRLTRDSDTGKRRITKRIVRTNYTWVDFFFIWNQGFFPPDLAFRRMKALSRS